MPPGAIEAGRDIDGSPLYVGRAYHEGDLIPAKVVASRRIAYVPHGGREHAKHDFEVLCNGDVSWVRCNGSHIPDNAISAGETENGETLYVGRTNYCGNWTPGKIQRSHGVMYFSFDGHEISATDYEILVEF